jgi:hypothetical protein
MKRITTLVVAMVVGGAACGGRTQLDPQQCGDPGGHCVTIPNVSSLVIYKCHVHERYLVLEEAHDGEIPVCLPPNLNRWTGTPQQVAAIDAMTQHEYDVAVARFGQDTLLGQMAALKAIDASGQNCDVWQSALGDPDSFCNVEQATRDSFCEQASSCATKTCVPNDCSHPTLPDGSINPHACACNTTVPNQDDCELPGAKVCIAP